MAGVVRKFFFASMFMWIIPIVILYGFNHHMFPDGRNGCVDPQIAGTRLRYYDGDDGSNCLLDNCGLSQLSSSSLTLLSGFLAVISVNLVIVFYIIMAMKEPSDNEHRPEPTFLADAKASISQSAAKKRDDPTEAHDKEE